MSIQIVTDSTCDLVGVAATSKGIIIVPTRVNVKGVSYKDGVDINPEILGGMLEQSQANDITTAHPAPEEYIEIYKNCQADQIISIHPSALISGDYNAALQASKAMEGSGKKIFVIDSGSISFGCGLLVLEASELLSASPEPDAEEIVAKLEESRKHIKVLFTTNDLQYLAHGGRVSRADAKICSIIKSFHIFRCETSNNKREAAIVPIDKSFDRNSALDIMLRNVENDDNLRPIKRIYVMYSHNFLKEGSVAPNEAVSAFYHKFVALNLHADIFCGEIGSAVMAHCGPDAIGVAYMS